MQTHFTLDGHHIHLHPSQTFDESFDWLKPHPQVYADVLSATGRHSDDSSGAPLPFLTISLRNQTDDSVVLAAAWVMMVRRGHGQHMDLGLSLVYATAPGQEGRSYGKDLAAFAIFASNEQVMLEGLDAPQEAAPSFVCIPFKLDDHVSRRSAISMLPPGALTELSIMPVASSVDSLDIGHVRALYSDAVTHCCHLVQNSGRFENVPPLEDSIRFTQTA